jgi:bifunctional non-homologous end joining protein LigD
MRTTNPDKIIYPAIGATKHDLVEHYRRVGAVMVPWVEGRPLTLERYPSGVEAKGFLQKNASAHFPDSIERVEIPKSDGTTVHPVADSVDDLVYLANQGTVTFHVWTSRLPDLTSPDWLVLDLDPSNDDLETLRRVVDVCRSVLDRFGLDAVPVASGSSGFHLWTPLVATLHYETVGRALWCLASLIAAEAPDLATVEFLKRNRRGRVFIDWLRNRWGATIAAPYSLRPGPDAPVATPLRWEEIPTARPDGWTISTVGPRLDDPPAGPTPVRLDVDAIIAAARDAGIDPDQSFDRFGRARSELQPRST